MAADEIRPLPGDTEYDLVRKILLALPGSGFDNGTYVAPKPADLEYDLWRKILNTLG